MKSTKITKRLLMLLGVVLILLAGSVAYMQVFGLYRATPTAQRAAHSATETADYWAFKPKAGTEQKDTAIIFYPGAFVQSDAYAIWAKDVAQAGYPVYVLKTPLSFSLIAQNKADIAIKNSHAHHFVIGGHSLGGVVASGYVAKHPKAHITGLLLLASYPQEKNHLANRTNLAVLSLTASQDQVLKQANYRAAKAWLPKDTQYQTIRGGNHGGFGSYGPQKHDGQATISNAQQQTAIADRIVNWLNRP